MIDEIARGASRAPASFTLATNGERNAHALVSPGMMVLTNDPLPMAAQLELAEFFRGQAEECLVIAKGTRDKGAATELISLAAMLHERAVNLEASAGAELVRRF